LCSRTAAANAILEDEDPPTARMNAAAKAVQIAIPGGELLLPRTQGADRPLRQFHSSLLRGAGGSSGDLGTAVTGLSTLSGDLTAKDAPSRDISVETKPLDEVYAGDVGFIKIDVEGHEHSVLQGAQQTIARCRPRVLVEVEERHGPDSVRRVHAFFRRRGYRGYFVRQRHLAPIECFDAARMQRSEDIADYAFGVPRARFDRYINNFLFLPPEEPSVTLPQLEAALTKPLRMMPTWPVSRPRV
jgi:hypothetical protein